MSAKPINTTVVILWDIESVCGFLHDVPAFLRHLTRGIKQRFNLGDSSRFRTTILHQYELDPKLCDVLAENVDVLDVGRKQTSTQVIGRKCRELLEDWKSNEVLLWVVSCEPTIIEHLRDVRKRGYNVFLVSDFERLPKSVIFIHWLEIYNFYVIARGDVRKLLGHKIPQQIRDRTLGFASPIVLSDLQLKCPPPPKPSSPPRIQSTASITQPEQDWNPTNDPVYDPATASRTVTPVSS